MGTKRVPFGDWLQDILDRKGWTISDLARQIGVQPSTVSRWRSGLRVPEPPQCRRIANALGINRFLVLYQAGHIDELPSPRLQLEAERISRDLVATFEATFEQAREELAEIRNAEVGAQVALVYYGPVPADSLRWSAGEQEGEMRRVPVEWIGTRAPEEFLVVTTADDGLAPLGIHAGYDVLIERTSGREPSNGEIVLVRVESIRRLAVWDRDGDWIELRDGYGTTMAHVSILADIEVIGFHRGQWYLKP